MSFKRFSASVIACRAMSTIRKGLAPRSALSKSILLAVPLLAGCAISKDLRLDRQGPGLPAMASVSIGTHPADNEQAARFAASLAGAFAERGHAVSDEARVTALFGFTRRERSIGTADGSPVGDAGKSETDWISAPARKRSFQSCKGERLRATLALYSRDEKTLIYRGVAEVDGCDFTNADIDGLALALVKAAAR